ncbi:MAG: hypothetical protein HY975_00475 [Candidatus Kerfeldbacteria bacterium]|nr:hypothetical protein [Candidatus Kerfeldbacteria bacterium]
MRRASILPIAVMAFAIVGFLFIVSYAITPDQRWPWSTNTEAVNGNVALQLNGPANSNTAIATNSATNTNTSNKRISVENNCGPLTDFSNQPWAQSLDAQYNDVFVTYQGISERTVWSGESSTGCLLEKQQVFVFIPEFFEFGCGFILKYDIAKNLFSRTPVEQPTACADTFVSLTDEYVEYSGGIGDGGTGTTFSGKYYFLDNHLLALPTASWKTYTNSANHFTIKYPSNYSQTVNGSTIQFQKNGDLEDIGYHLITVSVFAGANQNINSSQDLYTWAKNGFSKTAPIVVYHNNPRTVKLGENTFVATDGDQGSSGIPEYFILRQGVLYELTDLHPSAMTSDNQSIIATLQFTQ